VPIFEYECPACAQVFEVFTKRPEVGLAPVCPRCGAADAERVWSSFAGRIGEGSGCGSATKGFG
jgi:putative FmdB family regulatory protein